MGACARCSRRSLICSTFFIWIGSMLVLAFGVWCLLAKSELQEILGRDNHLYSAYVILTAGGASGVLSLLGCLGAYYKNRCLLITYFMVTLVILTLAIGGIILGLVFRKTIHQNVKEKSLDIIKKYDPNVNGTVERVWDGIQHDLRCCGLTNASDYQLYNTHFSNAEPYPLSCCNYTDTDTDCTLMRNAYQQGCIKALFEDVKYAPLVATVLGGATAFIMIMLMICSIIVFKSDDYERY